MKEPMKINHPADNDCTDERPDECAQAFVPEYDASNAADYSTNYSRDY